MYGNILLRPLPSLKPKNSSSQVKEKNNTILLEMERTLNSEPSKQQNCPYLQTKKGKGYCYLLGREVSQKIAKRKMHKDSQKETKWSQLSKKLWSHWSGDNQSKPSMNEITWKTGCNKVSKQKFIFPQWVKQKTSSRIHNTKIPLPISDTHLLSISNIKTS